MSRGDLKAEEEPRRMGAEPIISNRRCNHVGILTFLPTGTLRKKLGIWHLAENLQNNCDSRN
jgi:hypothetical protein